MHYKSIFDNFRQYVNADLSERDPKYNELYELKATYEEIIISKRWLSEVGILMRRIFNDAHDDAIRAL